MYTRRFRLWRLAARGVFWTLLVVFLHVIASPAVLAQGVFVVIQPEPIPLPRPILIPRVRPTPLPEMSYKIKEVGVDARIQDQVARVQVSQSFVNTGSRQMEVQFVFPLPYDGAVDQLTFLIDGKEYEAKLLPAEEARRIYEGYIRRNQDPALLEWMGTGMFRTSVFPVPPGAERKVTLRYNQLLRKDHKLTDFLFPLSTAKYTCEPVETVKFNINIESSTEIKNVYSPTHSVNIKRPDNKHAVVTFEEKNSIPTSDFRLFYDAAQEKLGASVITYRPDSDSDGYFLLLASPEIKAEKEDRPKKTVIFVADRSGSMSGKKIEQAKESLKFVLNNLREGDLFNIVAFDSSVESFRPELQKYDDESRKEALGFVEGIYAGGSTNIDGALKTAFGMLQDDSRPNFILFMTDGKPTTGVTAEPEIVKNARQQNKIDARLISFGVGYDVNSRLLDRLTRENHGIGEYVRPDEDIETHVSRLYSRISSPVLTDVEMTIDFDEAKSEDGKIVNRMYPGEVHDLFEGEQLVVVGRYKKPGDAKVVIKGNVGDRDQKFDFPAKFVKHSNDQTYAFVEKLWAVRRIGEIIDELDLKGQNQELVEELVQLSTKHGILTPYTSFLADENSQPADLAYRESAESRRQVQLGLERLSEAEGVSGFAQRAFKNELQRAAQAPAPSGGGFGYGGAAPALADAATPAADPSAAVNRQSAGGASTFDEAAGRYFARGGAPLPNALRDIDGDRIVVAEAVQTVGNEALYKRGKVWIAQNAIGVDPEKDKAKIEDVDRFSDKYFKLISENTAEENALLARQQAGEELLVKLRGQVYRIK
jgi:Ca-activated chloride channel family protein